MRQRQAITMSEIRLVQELFEQQAGRTPNSAALIYKNERLSYAELNRRANQLAHHLKESGVGLESLVGVCLPRSVESIVSLLGCFKAGGAYLPLDPEYPPQRLEHMLTDSRVQVLITNTDELAQAGQSVTTVIHLDNDHARIEKQATVNPEPLANDANTAYVIYTSGSTGNPKGVMVEHRSLANLLAASSERFGFENGDVMPCLASFSFDISLFEILNPLCNGGTVVIWDQKDVLDVQLLAESFEETTLLHCVPSLMHQVVSWLKEKNRRAGKLRQVFVGGEKVGVNLLEQMREVFPQAGINVLYGPTEATIICAERSVTGPVKGAPIGKALENVQLYVLDHDLTELPAGSVGELYLGGPGLARGYLDRPELTAEKFVPNRFSESGGERLYRTGDLVKWDSEGNLEFVGRADRQVKIRGNRIELGEVETALEACAGVSKAVAIVREDQPGQQRLVAYVLTEATNAQPALPTGTNAWLSPAINDYVYELTPISARPKSATNGHPFYQPIIDNVRDKVVLVAGANHENLLVKACVEGGAAMVYVAERSAGAYARTKRFVEEGDYHQVVPLLMGDEVSGQYSHIDLCVCDLIGDIGGSKGLEKLLRKLRNAIDAQTVVYPQRCITFLSAVELPESLREQPELHGAYFQDARRIFAASGFPFDLRVRVHQLPGESLISEESVFEQIACSELQSGAAATENQFGLTVSRDAILSGFALTVRVFGDLNGKSEDCRYATDSPVFVPVFGQGLRVEAGDRLEGKCVRRPSMNDDLHLDYHLEGTVLRGDEVVKSFFYRLPFTQRVFQGSDFYKRLFSATPVDQLVADERPGDDSAIAEELLEKLKTRLPDYMLPNAIVGMKEFPVTPNGKLDYKALPAPQYKRKSTGRAPVGPQQELLCALFADILGISRPDVDESFFDLGGDSLLLIHLIKRIRDALGVNLPIRTFFATPTVAALAEILPATEALEVNDV
jgi:amino acid adenylation domain-containing protein